MVPVELIVLAGIDHVETSDPKSHRRSEQQDSGIKRATYRDPRGRWSDPECESKYEMRPAGDSLGIGVDQYDGERDRREQERQAIELRGRKNKDPTGNDHKRTDKPRSQRPSWQRAHAG